MTQPNPAWQTIPAHDLAAQRPVPLTVLPSTVLSDSNPFCVARTLRPYVIMKPYFMIDCVAHVLKSSLH